MKPLFTLLLSATLALAFQQPQPQQDVTAEQAAKDSGLLEAAKRGDDPGVKAALEQGARPDAADQQTARTALMFAVEGGYREAAATLVKAGARVDVGPGVYQQPGEVQI